MNPMKLVAKVASMAVGVLIPIAMLSPGVAAAQEQIQTAHLQSGARIVQNRAAPNAWASRLSGLPAGGAAISDGFALYGGSAFYNVPAAPAAVKQITPNAWSSRLSGLGAGGAALYL
jgi:hypothetical protein